MTLTIKLLITIKITTDRGAGTPPLTQIVLNAGHSSGKPIGLGFRWSLVHDSAAFKKPVFSRDYRVF